MAKFVKFTLYIIWVFYESKFCVNPPYLKSKFNLNNKENYQWNSFPL